jgi:YidC/Oxa1 family membrane protein insertase
MDLFHTLIYLPLHNLLVFFVDVMPGADLGLAVIAVTLTAKFVLLPLSLEAAKTQKAMKALEPELKELKERYKDDKEAQARELLALYKAKDVKPFASILMLFVQIPIVFGLYFVCKDAITTVLDPSLLYSFLTVPGNLSPEFLGLFSVASTSYVLAVLAGATQFVQAWYVIPVPEKAGTEPGTMQEEFMRAMALQARFMLPVVIGLFALTSGAIALYFSASNLFMLGQEFLVRKLHKKE